jgi:hypothetical protein
MVRNLATSIDILMRTMVNFTLYNLHMSHRMPVFITVVAGLVLAPYFGGVRGSSTLDYPTTNFFLRARGLVEPPTRHPGASPQVFFARLLHLLQRSIAYFEGVSIERRCVTSHLVSILGHVDCELVCTRLAFTSAALRLAAEMAEEATAAAVLVSSVNICNSHTFFHLQPPRSTNTPASLPCLPTTPTKIRSTRGTHPQR